MIASQLKSSASKIMSSLRLPKISFSRPASLSIYLDQGNQLINRLTGYDQCERLRESVNLADRQFQELREKLQISRSNFTKAIGERSLCQKELNGLLQRKQGWIDTDLQRFTELYRNEMRLETVEMAAKESNEQLEKLVDQAHTRLFSTMRERYQEEQLWSDKIRRASTFGTLGLMLVNIALFTGLQLFVEPRKRRAFIEQFETVLGEKLEAEQTKRPPLVLKTVDAASLAKQQLLAGAAVVTLLNCMILMNFR